MPRESKYEAVLAARVTAEVARKVELTAERLGVKVSDVARWWWEEMPEGYVPRHLRKQAGKKRR